MSEAVNYCNGIIICKIGNTSVQIGASFTSSNEPSNWRGFTCHPDKPMLGPSFTVTCLACGQELVKYKKPKTDCSKCEIARSVNP